MIYDVTVASKRKYGRTSRAAHVRRCNKYARKVHKFLTEQGWNSTTCRIPDSLHQDIVDYMSSREDIQSLRAILPRLMQLGLNALKAGIPLPEMPEMPKYRSPGPEKPPSE